MNANPQRLDRQIPAIVVFAQQSKMVVGGAELFVRPCFVAADRRQHATGFHIGICLSTNDAVLNCSMQTVQVRNPTRIGRRTCRGR